MEQINNSTLTGSAVKQNHANQNDSFSELFQFSFEVLQFTAVNRNFMSTIFNKSL